MTSRRTLAGFATVATAASALMGLGTLASPASAAKSQISFPMVRSTASVAAGCLQHARAHVRVEKQGQTEKMTIRASGLPRNTEFVVFVTQLPNAPFGVSWYQSDLDSNGRGRATVTVKGRFNIETFAVAPAPGAAPTPHGGLDAATNPAFKPIHAFHVGLWFNSPTDAAKAGCLATVTPFNGDHNAGPQAMSTRNAPDRHGPLSRLGA
jgi:hypothetical protein